MDLFKKIKKIFSKEKLKARNFVEIHKSIILSESENVKLKLEKYKIPVYQINKIQEQNKDEMLYILRIPESFLKQAKDILNA
jgi:hypothetical protein